MERVKAELFQGKFLNFPIALGSEFAEPVEQIIQADGQHRTIFRIVTVKAGDANLLAELHENTTGNIVLPCAEPESLPKSMSRPNSHYYSTRPFHPNLAEVVE